jgi:hypothetical protein
VASKVDALVSPVTLRFRPTACDSLRLPGGILFWTAGQTDCGDWQPMRGIVGITAALFCLGWLAFHAEVVCVDASSPRAEDGWRRTTRGWERNVSLTAATEKLVPFWRRHPHPLVATLLLVMLSVVLLVAFTEGAFFDAASRDPRIATQGAVRA